jgi:D-alanyl-D-alanine dipeptidase
MRTVFVLLMIVITLGVHAQYKYGLAPTTLSKYKEQVKSNPDKKLVNLEDYIPNIVLDIRYATTNNFTGEKIYNLAKAYARKPVADALKQAQEEFNKMGYSIKVFDGYRPYAATVKFYEVYKDTTYVASPYQGSRHNRGCAIDMTIVDLKTGKEMKMPTGYDSFKKEAWPSTPAKDLEARKNRQLLITVMEKYGFKVNSSEWWHFDFNCWKNYEVLDIQFEELDSN